ncbi:hypothetical protein JV46_25760 [Solemya velum gill symbiont]|uniref:Uncharacterized protein n=1 Tax=Solemya velum gill symbiont TaxID=2340 RepID=A0A0B0H9K2_SOVGS|nr:hypothetical protein JV46_25760 [Solemya velum gill symbiont]
MKSAIFQKLLITGECAVMLCHREYQMKNPIPETELQWRMLLWINDKNETIRQQTKTR